MKIVLLASLIAAAMGVSTAVAVLAAPNHFSDRTAVRSFSDGSAVPGSYSLLLTNRSGAFMTLSTSGLTPGHAVTIWWVIFNHPENCTGGVNGLRCGEPDLADPDVQASVLFADGHIIGRRGLGHWGARLDANDTSGEILGGPGLTNPLGADIHLVVHDHGVVPWQMLREALHNFGPCFLPDPGPDGSHCADLQFAAHEH